MTLVVSTTSKFLSGFDPQSVPGCTLWLDASDPNTLTLSGPNVTQWRDKTANATAMTVSTGTPVLSNVNGMPSIQLNGSTRLEALNYTQLQGATDINWFAVVTLSNVNLSNGLIVGTVYSSDFSSQNTLVVQGSTDTVTSNTLRNVFRQTYDGSLSTVLRTAGTGGGIVASSVNFSTGTSTVLTNGTATQLTGGPTGVQDSSGVNLYIGHTNVETDSFITGSISECLLYTSTLSTLQRQQIEGYLARKWGYLTNLPATQPYRPLPVLTRPFQPIDVSGCSLWLDAADPTTLTTPVNVTGWNDKSGNGRHATFTVSNAPTYSAPAIQFSGVSQGLTTQLSASINTESGFVVAQFEGAGTIRTMLAASANGGRQFRVASGNTLSTVREGVAEVLTGGSNVPASTTLLAEYVNTGTTLTHYLNGTSAASGAAAGYTGGLTTRIGFRNNGTEGMNGSMYEVVVYSNAVSQSDRELVEGYLAWKWGTQASLPELHPYKSAAPVGASPLDVSGCALWLDAADTATITLVTTKISQWLDKSGLSNVATESTLARRPTYDITNKRVFFDSGSNQLMVINPAIRPTNIFVVANTITSNVENHLLRKGNAAGSDLEYFLRFTSSNTLGGGYVTTTSTAGSIDREISTPRTTKQLVFMQWNGSVIRLFQNATQLGADAALVGTQRTASSGATNLRIGASPPSSDNTSAPNAATSLNGYIYELVLYNRPPSQTERQQIEAYLMDKWGLRPDLPLAHPYRLSLPSTPVFTPRQIPSCVLWLDAADWSTLTFTGSEVTTWIDKSGSGNNASNFPQRGATYSSNGLVFSGSNSYGTQIQSRTSPQTRFIVGQHSSTTLMDLIGVEQVGSTGIHGVNSVLSNNIQRSIAWGGTVVATGATLVQDTRFLYGATIVSQGAAGTNPIFLNGTQRGSNTGTAPNMNGNGRTMIGAYKSIGGGGANGGEFFIGTMNEVLIYARNLSVFERQLVEGYLATKWGLKPNLPTTHSFKVLTP